MDTPLFSNYISFNTPEIQMFSTVLIGENNQAIIIPNSKITSDVIVNHAGVRKEI